MHHQEGWFLSPVIENFLFSFALPYCSWPKIKVFFLPLVMGGMLSLPGTAMKTVLPQLQQNIYLTKAVARCSKQS
jgi:hypothetical protein